MMILGGPKGAQKVQKMCSKTGQNELKNMVQWCAKYVLWHAFWARFRDVLALFWACFGSQNEGRQWKLATCVADSLHFGAILVLFWVPFWCSFGCLLESKWSPKRDQKVPKGAKMVAKFMQKCWFLGSQVMVFGTVLGAQNDDFWAKILFVNEN